MQSEKNTGKTMVAPRTGLPNGSFLGHLWAAIAVTLVLGIICCGIYPLIIFGVGQLFFPVQANGSLLAKDGSYTKDDSNAVGSALIGQNFTSPGYFHPRFSGADNSMTGGSVTGGYDASDSGATNLGPLSDKLINGVTTQTSGQPEALAFDGVRLRTIHYAVDNGISFKLYSVDANSVRTEVPISNYKDANGNLLDCKLVDAFPHGGATAGLIAANFSELIPGDAVTGSASGLDPHISPDNAHIQARRVAANRNISIDKVNALIDQFTDKPSLGFLGDPGVNVLRLNLAMDAQYPIPAAPATQPSK